MRLAPLPSKIVSRRALACCAAGAALLAAAALSPAAQAQAMTDIAISVSAYPSTSQSVVYVVGQKHGLFKAEGVNITRISGSGGGGQTVRNVISGELAFGDVATPAAALAFMKGEKIVMVGGSVQSAGELYFVARKGSGLKSIQDLRGKSVGYTSPGSVTQGVLELSLKNAGMKSSDVRSRAMGGINETITALLSGALDASANLEPLYSKNPDAFDMVFKVRDYVPAYQQTILITRPEFIKESPETVRAFLRGFKRSYEHIIQNPDDAAKIWSEVTDLDPKVTRSAIQAYLEAKQWNVAFNEASLKAVNEQMYLLGGVKADQKIPWAEMIDQSFLPAGAEKIDPSRIGTP